MKRRIVVATSAHRADDPRITGREAKSLASAFGSVQLLAPGFGDEAVPEGVSVSGMARRPGWGGRLSRVSRVGARGCHSKASVFHLHDPDLFLLVPLLRIAGHKVVIDLHEDYPRQVHSKPYLHPRVRRLASSATRLALRVLAKGSSAVVVADTFVGENLGLNDYVVVRNYTSISELPHPLPAYADRPHRIISMGSNTAARCYPQMVAAGSLLEEAEVVIAGIVADELAKSHPPTENVVQPGWTPRSEALTLVAESRVGWALMMDLPQYRLALPTKIFEYMLSGVPFVAADLPAIRELVESCECGVLVDATNPTAIADATRYLLENPVLAEEMGQRGRARALAHFEWSSEESRLVDCYRGLME